MHACMATQLLSFHHGEQVVFDVVRAHEVVLLLQQRQDIGSNIGGRLGPRRMFLTPKDNKVKRTAAAFCSRCEMARLSGNSLILQFKALASSVATTTAE
jgi:hypothetical protein